MVIWKEGNVLFNDALNTFYLRLYGQREREMFYLTTPSTHFILRLYGRKEMFYLTTHSTHFIYGYMEGRNILFNYALNTFYLRLYGRKEMFYLTTHSTHFISGYMASDIWLRTILIVRKETRCQNIGYFFRLAARVLLDASSPR